MLIISFATKNTPYEKVIKEFLLPSLERLKLPYDLAYPEDKGSWQLNTQLKPTVIKEMLLKHKQAVVYLDSDATIEYYPELFDKLQDYDIGVHSFDFYKFWRDKEGNAKREFLGGTLYFNYNEKVLTFVDEWINITKDKYNDQQTLNILVPQWKDRLNIYPLPIEYIAIRKTVKVPDYIINPCIIHNQKSRQYRNWRKK
jgi:hypothetical protein